MKAQREPHKEKETQFEASVDQRSKVILGPLAEDLVFMFRNINAMLRPVGAAIREPLGLEAGSIGVLCLLWVNPSISQNDLAENLAMKKSAITKLVKNLEAQGHIERIRKKGDRRVNALTLTDSGRLLVASIRGLSEPMNRALTTYLSDVEREVFFSVLEKLHSHMSGR